MRNGKKKRLSQRIFSKKQIKNIQSKINMMGGNVKFDALFFLNMRLFSSIVIFLVVLYISEWGYILAPLITFIYYHGLYYLMIEASLKIRCDKCGEIYERYLCRIKTKDNMYLCKSCI